MKLSEKIMDLRKKNGWSQEELGERLGVSRQSISKWESEQSLPELDKILLMSKLFGVTTDYLLKEEEGNEADCTPIAAPDAEATRADAKAEPIIPAVERISGDRANEILCAARKKSLLDAIGAALCILSPILLLLLGALSDGEGALLSETLASSFGLSALFIFVAIAVALFVYAEFFWKSIAFPYGKAILLDGGVSDLLFEGISMLNRKSMIRSILAVILYIMCPIPVILASLAEAGNLAVISSVCLLLAMVACGVFLQILSERSHKIYRCLLSMDVGDEELERDEDGEEKETSAQKLFGSLFWPAVTVGYLLWSFLSGDWFITWIVWPVAGCISAIVEAVLKYKNP